MLCCTQTACKTCVLAKMPAKTIWGSIENSTQIMGEFKCHFCESSKYCPKGFDKYAEIHVNKTVLEMLQKFDDMLPVCCDLD